VPESKDVAADLLRMMGSPDLASRRWIWEQYDHMVGADTVQRPGGDAAVVRVHGTEKALAITTDCTPRYCYADPYEGGKQAIAEAWRNLTAVGATPLAATDCMNFANPQRPEIMGQFVGCIEGMAEACRALDFPIVSGNVSLYNESKATGGGSAILPTPAIGGVGLIRDWRKAATLAFKAEEEWVFVVGGAGDCHLGQSLWLRDIHGREEGPPPPVDLAGERAAGDFIRQAIADGLVSAVHDVADGGILVAAAEMALAGDIGLVIEGEWFDGRAAARLFGEDQGRYLVSTARADAFAEAADAAGIDLAFLGRTGGAALAGDDGGEGGAMNLQLADLRRAHEAFFPSLMGKDLAVA
jgi:phosphoribosylformylglycinamidine synthase